MMCSAKGKDKEPSMRWVCAIYPTLQSEIATSTTWYDFTLQMLPPVYF